jgi:hypothetical protein
MSAGCSHGCYRLQKHSQFGNSLLDKLKTMGCGDMNWINLSQGMVQYCKHGSIDEK